jgi:hypothetical protein
VPDFFLRPGVGLSVGVYGQSGTISDAYPKETGAFSFSDSPCLLELHLKAVVAFTSSSAKSENDIENAPEPLARIRYRVRLPENALR